MKTLFLTLFLTLPGFLQAHNVTVFNGGTNSVSMSDGWSAYFPPGFTTLPITPRVIELVGASIGEIDDNSDWFVAMPGDDGHGLAASFVEPVSSSSDVFHQGFYWGAVIVAFCFALSMLRSIDDSGKEEL